MIVGNGGTEIWGGQHVDGGGGCGDGGQHIDGDGGGQHVDGGGIRLTSWWW